ncbi:MAG: hypothetical protein AAF849_12790 [Bacteroidota bacterium]
MESNHRNLDKLDRYFEGSLEDVEIQALNEHLKDKTFRKDALFFDLMVNTLKEEEEAQLEEMVRDVDADKINSEIRSEMAARLKKLQAQEVPKKREQSTPKEAKVRNLRPMRRVLAIAASLLVLVIAGTFWWNSRSYNPSELIRQNYYAADVPGTLSGGAVEDEVFQTALTAFAATKDLGVARAGFEQITPTNSKYGEAQYFLGQINLQEEKFEAAIRSYENALAAESLPNYLNQSKLNWNLLLARLGAGEDISSDLNRLIEEGNPPYDQKAENLKKRLK